MVKPVAIFLLCGLLHCAAFAQNLEPLPAALEALQPVDLFPAKPETGYNFIDNNPRAKGAATFTPGTRAGAAPLFTAEVPTAAPSNNNIQVAWKSAAPVKKGDVLLARLTIRALYARQESGDAVVYFFSQATNPYDRNVLMELSVGPEWKTIAIPFVSAHDAAAGEESIGFTLGALAQKVEITNVQLFNFQQKAPLAQMPATRFTYGGREAGAEWRKQALKRIEEIRTAPLRVRVTDAQGRPVAGARVQARLVDPEFVFGTAVSVNQINGTDATADTYRRHLLELFNGVTIDNNLKWPEWRDPRKRAQTKVAVQWLLDHQLRLRGHNLVWPSRKFAPAVFGRQADFGPGFADSIDAHIKDIVSYTKGKVYAWDVINEMVHEQDYFTAMPRTQAVQWFKLARQSDPKAQLYINEYSMLNNIASPQNIREYLGVVAELRQGGAPIDALGVQGHVGRQPRNPAQVVSDLDLFRPTGLPVQITEFDINSPDEALQADYTRDFLIACYSHPAVTGFTMWGFWQGAHWKPDAAMYRTDWSAKPNLAAWQDLVTRQWRTNVSASSDARGQVMARGHLGRYEITVTKGKTVVKVPYQLRKDGPPAAIKL